MTQSDVQCSVGYIPAAQYVRMSDELQQYSIDNQKAAIQEYASLHHFVVVKTYSDAGKSGVKAKNRPALRELLTDVINGNAGYKAILVYGVSRWGRFPNNDEAAHYEFLCCDAGIPLHYCAEQFANDGTASSSLLKALKRSMAAEFSRELGEKVFRGKTRLVRMGYWVGGQAGYGYRRLMVSAENKPKQLMKAGERKSLTTDRVILVPGSKSQCDCVEYIFSRALQGDGCTAIARDLNQLGIPFEGSQNSLWTNGKVFRIVTNPKYAGWNVWNRGTERILSKFRHVDPKEWITKPGAFRAIVDQETFDRAQAALPRQADFLWSDAELLRKLRRLLETKGRISESILLRSRGMPSPNVLKSHFGSLRQACETVGYYRPNEDGYRIEKFEPSLRLRRAVVRRIKKLFPSNVEVTHLPKGTRSILRIDNTFMVSILLCRRWYRPERKVRWIVEPVESERENITLLCRIGAHHKCIASYHLFRRMDVKQYHHSFKSDPWLATGTKLKSLSEFYDVAKLIWMSGEAEDRPSASLDVGL